ncbi:MAG TPA: Holliday junction resolvase RuvX [Ignavibacteriaceae bacterium]|nr:Holliday junction resolvase RuvX [Ignavibacteriaceae bacterium]
MINETRFLAIDYGLKRIGLALTDPLFTFAYPFKTIENNNRTWEEILKIIKEKNVVKIILGNPLNKDGTVSKLSGVVEDFKKQLELKTKLEVVIVDERYSSQIAKERVIESVAKKSKRRDKGILDRNAAAVILQVYMDSNPKR